LENGFNRLGKFFEVVLQVLIFFFVILDVGKQASSLLLELVDSFIDSGQLFLVNNQLWRFFSVVNDDIAALLIQKLQFLQRVVVHQPVRSVVAIHHSVGAMVVFEKNWLWVVHNRLFDVLVNLFLDGLTIILLIGLSQGHGRILFSLQIELNELIVNADDCGSLAWRVQSVHVQAELFPQVLNPLFREHRLKRLMLLRLLQIGQCVKW